MTTRIGMMITCLALVGPMVSAVQETEPDSTVVAAVNGEPLHFEDVERQLRTLHSGQSETQRTAFDLDRLMVRVINDALLAQEALLLEMDEEEPVPTRLQELREEMGRERLEAEEIWSRVELSEAEVQRTFEEAYERATFRILTVEAQEEAEKLRQLLDDGADFEALGDEAAATQETPRYRLFEGIARIEVPKAIKAVVFDLVPGQIAGPLSTNLGWSIVRLEGIEKASQEDFPKFEKRIREETRFRKADALRKKFTQQLRSSFEVSIDPTTADIGVNRLSDGRLRPIVERPEAIVVTAGGRTVTAEKYGEALQHSWRAMRSQEAALASRSILLDRIISHELMIAEALRRGYGETPEVERAVKSYRTELLIPRFLSEVLAASIKVSPEEKEAYYEAHREEFRQLPKLRVRQITVNGQDEAERIAGLLQEKADFAWLAEKHSIDKFKSNGGDRGWIVPSSALGEWQELFVAADPGTILGQFPEQEGRFIVFRVDAKEEQGYYALKDVSGNVGQAVFDEKLTQALDDILGKLRESSEIKIYDEALARMSITGSNAAEDSHAETMPEHN